MTSAENGTGDPIAPSQKVTRTKRTTPAKKATPKLIDVPLPTAGIGQIRSADADIEFDRWLWDNFIPEGTFMVISGAGGVGKSSLLAFVLAGLSKGTLEGDFFKQPQNSIWYSREDSTTVSLKGKLVAAEANEARIVLMDQNGERGGTTLTLPADLEKLSQDVADNHYKVVVLDLLMSFCDTKRSLYQNYGNVVQVFSRIAEMCAARKVTVIGVMHNKNGSKEASADSVISSLAIPGVARMVLMCGDLGDTGLKVVGAVKSNISKTMVGYVYRVNYVEVARDSVTGKPKLASQIELLRPATPAEVKACLEKPKSINDSTPQIKEILKALAVEEVTEIDGEMVTTWAIGKEMATKSELYPLVVVKLGVKMRRFQAIVADAISIGVLDSRVEGNGGDQRNLVRINARGLMLLDPPNTSLDDDDDDDVPETMPIDRQKAEVIYKPGN